MASNDDSQHRNVASDAVRVCVSQISGTGEVREKPGAAPHPSSSLSGPQLAEERARSFPSGSEIPLLFCSPPQAPSVMMTSVLVQTSLHAVCSVLFANSAVSYGFEEETSAVTATPTAR